MAVPFVACSVAFDQCGEFWAPSPVRSAGSVEGVGAGEMAGYVVGVSMAKKKKVATSKPCICLEAVQKKLSFQTEKHCGARIVTAFIMNFKSNTLRESPPALLLEKINPKASRKPLPTVVCAFCPFCGKRYKV